MWDDVVVGNGNKGNSAMSVFGIPGEHSISENAVSFWIYGCIFGIGMTIFKDTAEGKLLQSSIKLGTPAEKINDWLDEVVLRNADSTIIKEHSSRCIKNSFQDGKAAKLKEIREALGF